MKNRFLLVSVSILSALSLSAGNTKDFSRVVSLHDITFTIEATNSGSVNELSITPSGLRGKNKMMRYTMNGSVMDAQMADLDRDGSPELYLFISSTEKDAYGKVLAYAVDSQKRLQIITMAELDTKSNEHKGYKRA